MQQSSSDSKPPLSNLLPFRSCFCEGRTGSLVTAWLQAIGSVVLIILLGLYLLNSKVHHHYYSPETFKICASTFFVMMVVNGLLSILLLYGAYNEMKKIVSLYVKVRMVYLIAGFLAVMFFGIQFCIGKFYGGVAIIIMGLLIIAIDLYLWLVVYSYYHLLKLHENDEHGDRNLLI